jgi:hypothetical protein
VCALGLTSIAASAQTCNELKAEVARLEQALANDKHALANCKNSPGSCTPGQTQSWEAAIQIATDEINADLQQERTACAPPHPPNTDHISLQGMEVTQAIQDMDNSVTLIAGKTTWVRVYFDKNNGTRAITAQLVATRSGGGTTTVAPTAGITVDASEDLKTRRTNWTKSLNFFLPPSITAAGTVTFKLTAVANAGPGTTGISCAGCANLTQVTFYNEPPLVVRAVGLSYTFGSPPALAAPSVTDFALLRSWLGRAYPVAAVTYSRTTVASTNAWPFSCDKANAQLVTIRASDISSGTDVHTHYLGLVSNQGGYMRGCSSGVPTTADPGTTASGPAGPISGSLVMPVNVSGDTDGSFGDWYGGHELAHTFGRAHPGFCNTNPKDDTRFPYPNGQIGTDVDTGYAGLDTGDSTNLIALAVLWPTSSFDIMTYCNQPQWLSAYTYEAVRQRLLDENPGFRTLARRVISVQNSILTGRMVHVAATINLTRGTGEIEFVTPVERAPAQIGATTRAALVVRDATGRQLSRTPVALRETTDIPPGEDQTALVDATVPFTAAMAQIDLMLDDKLLSQYRNTTTAPVPPRSLRIGASADAAPILTWAPSSAEGGTVTYTVQTSNDGNTWATIAVGLKEPKLALSADQMRTRMARVIASTGFRSSSPLTIQLRQ